MIKTDLEDDPNDEDEFNMEKKGKGDRDSEDEENDDRELSWKIEKKNKKTFPTFLHPDRDQKITTSPRANE